MLHVVSSCKRSPRVKPIRSSPARSVIPRNPKSIRAVVRRLNSLLRLNLDFPDLDREAEEFEAKLGFMASHNPEFQTYIEELEKDFTEVKYQEPLDISANEAVQIAEELLKEKREE